MQPIIFNALLFGLMAGAFSAVLMYGVLMTQENRRLRNAVKALGPALDAAIEKAVDKAFDGFVIKANASNLEGEGETAATASEWMKHAYPLQQVTIKLQGTRHSDKAAIVAQLETVLARLKAGDTSGQDHDDDFGYAFEYLQAVPGPSFFDEPAGSA